MRVLGLDSVRASGVSLGVAPRVEKGLLRIVQTQSHLQTNLLGRYARSHSRFRFAQRVNAVFNESPWLLGALYGRGACLAWFRAAGHLPHLLLVVQVGFSDFKLKF